MSADLVDSGRGSWLSGAGAALRNPAFIVAAASLVIGAIALRTVVASMRIHLRKTPIEAERQVNAIPEETLSWRRVGQDRIDSKEMVEELGTSNYLNRFYEQKTPAADSRPHVLDLHLAYYTGMVDTVPHVPERCLVGGGWVQSAGTEVRRLTLDNTSWVLDREVGPPERRQRVYTARMAMDGRYSRHPGTRVRLPRDPDQIEMRITPFTAPGSERKHFAGYFFIANGGHVPSAEDVRLLAFNLTDDYAFYLKVQVSSSTVSSAEELANLSSSLLSELLPEIMMCVPDWVRVQEGDYPPDNPRRPKASN